MVGQLDEIWRQLSAGRMEEAEAACRIFLEDDPRHAEALNLLARIQSQRGNQQQAVESIRKAIDLQPDNGILHRNLGFIHFLAGDIDESIGSYRRALQLNPRDAETRNSLGVALRQKGILDEAVQMFQAAVDQRPDLAYSQRNLAELLCQQGKLSEAAGHFEEAVCLTPDDAEARNGLGLVFMMQNVHAKAAGQFVEAIKLRREYAEAQLNLAKVLCFVDSPAGTGLHNDDHLGVRKEIANILVSGGNALVSQGRTEEAIVFNEQAIRLEPDNYCAHNNQGMACIEQGRFDEAVALLEKSLELAPDFTLAYKNLGDLARQNRYQLTSSQLDRMKTLAASAAIPPDDASTLQFTIGNVLESQGQFDEAFFAYQQGNETKLELLKDSGHAFDPQQQQTNYDAAIAAFGRSFFERRDPGGLETETPIFVVGMPRSGTTLVEQIIASHPQAAGAGELTFIKRLSRQLAGMVDGNDPYPECILKADQDTIAELARRYLRHLAERGHTGARIVDKTPGNFVYLGFIATLFPNARVIHCRRDAMDVCFSCYSCKFNYINWSWRLEDIGFFYRQYERLMKHWRDTLPLHMHDVRYEELVSDHQRVNRELIEFCGLDWDDKCLEYYKNRNIVQTASRVQVRQPIYTSSVGRWKKYEQYLSPLKQALKHDIIPNVAPPHS